MHGILMGIVEQQFNQQNRHMKSHAASELKSKNIIKRDTKKQ